MWVCLLEVPYCCVLIYEAKVEPYCFLSTLPSPLFLLFQGNRIHEEWGVDAMSLDEGGAFHFYVVLLG